MDSDLPKRKSPRLKGFDYNISGAYFLTICVKNRKNILSSIVGAGFPNPDNATLILKLTHYGEIADKWIKIIPQKYQEISVDRYVIMPDHIHLLLSVIKNDESETSYPMVEAAMGWFKYQVTKEINQARGTTGETIFQRSFYDHIVRNRDDYNEINKYIYENPMRWLSKQGATDPYG